MLVISHCIVFSANTQGTGSLTPIATVNPTAIPTASPIVTPTTASPTTAALAFASVGPGEVSYLYLMRTCLYWKISELIFVDYTSLFIILVC